jgi:hypothetical protein
MVAVAATAPTNARRRVVGKVTMILSGIQLAMVGGGGMLREVRW